MLRGNPSRRPLPAGEPKPEALREAKPPHWLKGRARRAWIDLAPLLIKLKVLTEADRMALGMLCDVYGEYLDARDVVRHKGMTYETRTTMGGLKIQTRPEVFIAADAWRRTAAMMQQFGLTPASRSKVSATDEADEDPIEAFLRSM